MCNWGNNSWWWIIILLLILGWGNNGCGCGCDNGCNNGPGYDNILRIIIIAAHAMVALTDRKKRD